MKIVVCVSDEVLNSQHYKHSQSTEASDQYANELILYLNELLNIAKICQQDAAFIYMKYKHVAICYLWGDI